MSKYDEIVADLKADKRIWREVSEEDYYWWLNCVPPARIGIGTFVMGEPYSHNSKGEMILLCARETSGKLYAIMGTLREYDSRELLKFPLDS